MGKKKILTNNWLLGGGCEVCGSVILTLKERRDRFEADDNPE